MISFFTESQNQTHTLRASVPQQAFHSKQYPHAESSSSSSSDLIVDFPARPRRRPEKCVRFAESSILHQWIDERKSPQESWETKSDYNTFRCNLKHEVIIVRKQFMSIDVSELDADGNNEICIRGVEHLICPRTLQKIIIAREEHKTAVLEEQFRQNALCRSDPAALRSVSKSKSKWGKARAWAYAGGTKESRRGCGPRAA
mmetsp:Transcript_14748/g.31064  ORF Transcript_14748/g.31064 Transcript_14748/m.31064 type:complete len:201 (+) Transcript_14748:78-680(+)